jgi:hypothetical protein
MGGRRFRRVFGAILGVVAAIAIPFVAGPIASAVFGTKSLLATTATGALLGAGAGAISSAVGGGNIGTGALLGGLGGGIGGFSAGGGFGSLFGTSPAAAAAPGAGAPQAAAGGALTSTASSAPGVAAGGLPLPPPPMPAAPAAGVGSAVAPGVAAPVAAGIGTTGAGVAAPAAAGVAAPAAAGVGSAKVAAASAPQTFTEAIRTGFAKLSSPTALMGAGQIAMTLFNRPPSGLTPQERAYVQEMEQLAGTNRELFDQRIAQARALQQQATPDPSRAYATANLTAQRHFSEVGLRNPEQRRAAELEGSRRGAQAIPAEQQRALTASQAALSALPTTAPAGASTLSMAAYRDAERRQREYERDLATGTGTLFSSFT